MSRPLTQDNLRPLFKHWYCTTCLFSSHDRISHCYLSQAKIKKLKTAGYVDSFQGWSAYLAIADVTISSLCVQGLGGGRKYSESFILPVPSSSLNSLTGCTLRNHIVPGF